MAGASLILLAMLLASVPVPAPTVPTRTSALTCPVAVIAR